MGKGVDEHGSFKEAEEPKSDINTRQLKTGSRDNLSFTELPIVVARMNKLS